MAYCGPRGIPHSQFLAWPEMDRLKAMAWTMREAATCGRCGTVSDEWTAPDDHGNPRPVDPPPFQFTGATCYGCMEKEAFLEDRFGTDDKRTPLQRDDMKTTRIAVQEFNPDRWGGAASHPPGRH